MISFPIKILIVLVLIILVLILINVLNIKKKKYPYNKVLIKFFADFTTSEECKERFDKCFLTSQYKDWYGPDKYYYFTNEDDYTHAILLNKAMPKLKIPKKNVLGLSCEPLYFLQLNDKFIKYAQDKIGLYYIGDSKGLPEPFVEHHGFLWHSNPGYEITLKNKVMSIIVSGKKEAPGHKYRHELVESIIENKLPIDIYGRGTSQYNYEHIKGSFEDEYIPFKDYLFSICIENFSTPHYISEKLITPLMYNCKPLYLGCENVSLYFEKIIILTGNVKDDMDIIMSVLSNPYLYYEKTYTVKNRHSANLLEHLPSIGW